MRARGARFRVVAASATIARMAGLVPGTPLPVVGESRAGSRTEEFLEQALTTPFDFQGVSSRHAVNPRLKKAVNKATLHQYTQRLARMPELPDADGIRSLAGDIKQHTLDHLDYYLEQLKTNVEKNGGHVHFAATAADARRIIMRIVESRGC